VGRLSPERTVFAISTLGGYMGCLSLRPAPTRLTALAGAASQPHAVASMTVAASWSGSAVSERNLFPPVCAQVNVRAPAGGTWCRGVSGHGSGDVLSGW
jgi:hypothetical protein